MERPYLRSQSELLADIRAEIVDEGSPGRYTDEEVYRSLNRALTKMSRFVTPMVYTPSALTSARSVALPDYMDRRIEVEHRALTTDVDRPNTWRPLQGWEVVADGSGGLTLEFRLVPISGDIRILWYAPSPVLPVSLPTLDVDIDSDDTSMSITAPAGFMLRRAGWIEMGDERMFYSGVAKAGVTITLSGLLRAQDDTTAGAHASTTDVEWCVPFVLQEQQELLFAYTMSQLHGRKVTDGSNNERDNHSVMIRYWDDQAKSIAQRIPGRRGKMRLNAQAFGEMW